MKSDFYQGLKDDFIIIRHLHTEDNFNKVLLEECTDRIKTARNEVYKLSQKEDVKFLLYCIDSLLEIIEERNTQKICDFADAIHNVPEIYVGKRNLYSFGEEMLAFRKKYGKKYFKDFLGTEPKFNKKAPKNVKDYFSPDSDVEFKLLHPIAYKILCAVGCVALLLPVFVYLAYVLFINPAPNDWKLILGSAGAFIMGIGFFNIVAAWIHQYLGHSVTVFCIVGGAGLTALSMILLYG